MLKYKMTKNMAKLKTAMFTTIITAAISGTAMAGNSFPDTQHHWANNAVNVAVERGLISGYPNGEFRPDNVLLREEFSKIAYLTAEIKEDNTGETFTKKSTYSNINDVNGRWSQEYVNDLSEKGIFSGYPDGTFRPENKMKRSEFANVIYQIVGDMLNGGSGPKYGDLSSSHWAESKIRALANQGFLNGYPDGTFRPDNYITRAEATASINLVIDYISKGSKSTVKTETITNKVQEIPKIEEITKEAITIQNIPQESAAEVVDIEPIVVNDVAKLEEYDTTGVSADQTIALVNEYRIAHGVNPLRESEFLNGWAEIRAREIETLFSHDRPNGETRMTKLIMAGENIAYTYSTSSEEVVGLWYDSEGHRRNMLHPEYVEMGSARYIVGDKTYWVHLFKF